MTDKNKQPKYLSVANGDTRPTNLPIRTVNNMPSTFRLALYPCGRQVIQGGYFWTKGFDKGIEWRDLPLVPVNESGHETSLAEVKAQAIEAAAQFAQDEIESKGGASQEALDAVEAYANRIRQEGK